MLQWISQKIQIIDVNYLGNWSGPKMNLPKWSSRWRRLFAWYPVKLDDGDIIFFKHYWVNETFMQNPYNGAKGYMVTKRMSESDKILHTLRK